MSKEISDVGGEAVSKAVTGSAIAMAQLLSSIQHCSDEMGRPWDAPWTHYLECDPPEKPIESPHSITTSTSATTTTPAPSSSYYMPSEWNSVEVPSDCCPREIPSQLVWRRPPEPHRAPPADEGRGDNAPRGAAVPTDGVGPVADHQPILSDRSVGATDVPELDDTS